MNKLEEYRDKKIAEEADFDGIDYRNGFDAAIALDLPVKFAEWAMNDNNPYAYIYGSGMWRKIGNSKEEISPKELYQYWIDNVYKPE